MKKPISNPVKTALTITVGFLIIYWLTDRNWALWVALVVGLSGVFSPYLSKQIEVLWMGINKVLSYIMPNVLLSVIFYLVLFPIALASRVFGKKDPMHLKKPQGSLFRDSNKVFDKKSFENPW